MFSALYGTSVLGLMMIGDPQIPLEKFHPFSPVADPQKNREKNPK